MIIFHEKFPEIAGKEYIAFATHRCDCCERDVKYLALEHYCVNRDCRCNSCTIALYRLNHDDQIDNDADVTSMIVDWKEPKNVEVSLREESKQASNADDLLNRVRAFIKQGEFIDMLKSHYKIARDKFAGPIRKEATIGRNDPCFCGSGVKYKKCCAKLGEQLAGSLS